MTPTTKEKGMMLVSVEEFSKTREKVIACLCATQKSITHVQQGLGELLEAYLKHTATILEGEDGYIESLQLPASLTHATNAVIAAATTAVNHTGQSFTANIRGPTTAAASKKRKREKKHRDPNAPKRPLTAAFLFAKEARHYVKRDLEVALGPNGKLEPNAVNFEINKRWNDMPEEEKENWKASYRASLENWKEEMKAYLASKGAAEELPNDDEGSDEADAGAIDSEEELDEDGEANGAAASPVAAKAPTPPPVNGKTPRNTNKRQKTAVAAPATIAPTPVPVPRQAAQVRTLPSDTVLNTPSSAKKDNNKKKRGAAAETETTPAPAVEESGKKKSKSGRTTRSAEAEIEAAVEKETPKPKAKRDRSKRKSEAAAA